jgi:hypothetical protein
MLVLSAVFIGVLSGVLAVWAAPRYNVTFETFDKQKASFDDPRPVMANLSFKKILPSDVYSKLTYDVEAMKRSWADVVGFKAPDVVGKIAPDIKPGTYTYKDKERYPGFKELMWQDAYKRFAAGGPPHVGNMPEIKVVPTRQYYWALPIAEATKMNTGKTALDKDGYLVDQSYEAGHPFPRPSGKFKATEIIYNWLKCYYNGDSTIILANPMGFTKGLKKDFDGVSSFVFLRLQGRVLTEPHGWLDKRASERREFNSVSMLDDAPRDRYGNVFNSLQYTDPNKFDQDLVFINAMRRIRKMSATDTQDPVAGQDIIYDDNQGFSQKLTPRRYPYKIELIGEREYLVPAPTIDGSRYLSSKDFAFYNMEFERRPVYVVKMVQQDRTYVYSTRILYIDQETFLLYYIENYDQKGRLYRTMDNFPGFYPEMGVFFSTGFLARDHIDLHSTYGRHFAFPAKWLSRENIDMGALTKKGK